MELNIQFNVSEFQDRSMYRNSPGSTCCLFGASFTDIFISVPANHNITLATNLKFVLNDSWKDIISA